MELSKKLVHMEKEYPSVSSEFVIEEDLIIPDSKPDILKILLHRNELLIHETRIQEQKVFVNGVFHFSVLYSPENNPAALSSIHGEIPFDEEIQMDGVTISDTVNITADVEDMNLRIINSRKCNLHALIGLSAVKTQLYDVELPVEGDNSSETENSEPLMIRSKKLDYLELNTLKKDICRIKEELRLPDNFPTIETLLWSSTSLNDMEIIPAAGKLSLSCNLQVFFIYVGEGEEQPIRYYESTIPFSTSLECDSSMPGLIPNITYQVSQSSVDVKNNSDGEARLVSIEQILDLNIRLYQENSVQIIDDVYSCQKECNQTREKTSLSTLCERNTSRQVIQGSCKLTGSSGTVLQLIYPSCQLTTDTPKITDNGVEICGLLQVQSLYLRNNDEVPFDSFSTTIPFCHKIEINNIEKNALSSVMISLDKISISSVSESEAEMKATVNYEILVTAPCEENLIQGVTLSPLDPYKMDCLPGIIIYFVKPGDTLWQLAKDYYVPVETIRTDNELTSDNLYPGQQLLIVR